MPDDNDLCVCGHIFRSHTDYGCNDMHCACSRFHPAQPAAQPVAWCARCSELVTGGAMHCADCRKPDAHWAWCPVHHERDEPCECAQPDAQPEPTDTLTTCPRCSSPVAKSYVAPNGAATYTTSCGERWKFYADGDGPHRDWSTANCTPACDEITALRAEYTKYADLYEVVYVALADLLKANDADFCQGEVYIAEDEQAECGACAWCRSRIALGLPEANAVPAQEASDAN